MLAKLNLRHNANENIQTHKNISMKWVSHHRPKLLQCKLFRSKTRHKAPHPLFLGGLFNAVGQPSLFALRIWIRIILRSHSEPFHGDATLWLDSNKGLQAGGISCRRESPWAPLWHFYGFVETFVCVNYLFDDNLSLHTFVGRTTKIIPILIRLSVKCIQSGWNQS